jgi:hypothetical protein
MPDTATVYVDGPPVTTTFEVPPAKAVTVTVRSWARRPMSDGGL